MPQNKNKYHINSKKDRGGIPKEKSRLHSRNKHRERYDFKQLVDSSPELAEFVALNKYGDQSIDFSNAVAVKSLNKALLKYFYNIDFWDIPPNYLCPPIPGRADYIHHIADLLCSNNYGIIPTGDKIKCLDIGVGANCVYPIIGRKEYNWSFIGSDTDPLAINSANRIVDSNPILKGKVELKLQNNPQDFFYGIIQKDDQIDFSICNPQLIHCILPEVHLLPIGDPFCVYKELRQYSKQSAPAGLPEFLYLKLSFVVLFPYLSFPGINCIITPPFIFPFLFFFWCEERPGDNTAGFISLSHGNGLHFNRVCPF